MTLRKRPNGSPTGKLVGPAKRGSTSIAEIARRSDVQLALDNDVLVRVAENCIALRKHRRLTQNALAKLMGTSQAALARIEGAQENITLRTLGKAIEALRGRLTFYITPAELNLPVMPPWYNLVPFHAAEPYECKFLGGREGAPVRVGIGWVSPGHSVVEGETIMEESVRLGPGESKTGEITNIGRDQGLV
jgi:transcriptional regulator with XRE-family HTH domain